MPRYEVELARVGSATKLRMCRERTATIQKTAFCNGQAEFQKQRKVSDASVS
jgi:hypothetical protein